MPDLNVVNRTLFHGDNLEFLRGINSETINLIATDPPFNKNRDFHATPDSSAAGARFQDRWRWHEDVHEDWMIAIQKDAPEVWQVITTAKTVWGDDMGAYLCWLGVRLLEMHRILSDDGSLYLHLDHTAHAWVKCLMDAIFDRRNFRNEIVWCYKSGGASPSRYFSRKHDTILWYTKNTQQYCFNPQVEKSYNREFKPYRFAGVQEYEDEKGWYTLVGMKDYWEIDMVGRTSKERKGYPTQKPLALYERIIKASSNPGDMVLDPFCGCATTPVAAERLGRHWIGMDIWEGAHQMVLDRLEQENLAVKTRLDRRQGQQTLTFGDITYSHTPPLRTDKGETAALVLEMPAPKGRSHPSPRTRHGELLTDIGAFCQGCGADYNFDTRVLEVDHINPRSQGGTDAYDNLTLLCPPCNKEKRDRYTLIGLQHFNKTNGYMKNEGNLRMGRAAGRRPPGRRKR